jgi:hypothetical protein
MATYQPPIANLPIFDAAVFTKDTTLTIEKADARYLYQRRFKMGRSYGASFQIVTGI